MPKFMKYTVLGSGNGARAFCGQIAAKGYSVMMYEPLEETADYLKLKAEKEMFLKGDITAGGRLAGVTLDMAHALKAADVVFIVVPSFAHPPIFKKMIAHLREGQHVVIVPGNYGSFLLKKMMSELSVGTNISISETASLPYACRIDVYNTVLIHKKKYRLKIATSPREQSQTVLDIMNDIFRDEVQFFPGRNLLEAALDNINYTLHPMPVLLNYGDIEKNPQSFRHYIDGLTPLIAEKMMQMDEERLNLGRLYGLNLISALDQLKMYYGSNDAGSYYEFVNSPESPYKDIVGHNVRSRYITEDVPCLLVPAIQLARLAGVRTPLTELCVNLASALHDVDYEARGTTLETLGLAGKSPEEIVALAS